MQKIQNLVLVGCGHMGGALLRNWLENNELGLQEIHVVDPGVAEEYRFESTDQIKLAYHDTYADVPADVEADCVFFAIKPQMVEAIVPDYHIEGEGPLYISILAGTKIATLSKYLGDHQAFVRIMPNLPVRIQQGANVAFAGQFVNDVQRDFVDELFNGAGILKWVQDEGAFDAVTALSGSGPAYLFAMAEAMMKAGVAEGLDEDLARDLAIQTLFGAAKMLHESSEPAIKLRENVTSKGGTTEAGLKELIGEGALEDLMKRTIFAAKQRSVELG